MLQYYLLMQPQVRAVDRDKLINDVKSKMERMIEKRVDAVRVRVCSPAVLLVHDQVTVIFVVSVCLSVCLFVCTEFFSVVFDPISIKLGHMLYVWV